MAALSFVAACSGGDDAPERDGGRIVDFAVEVGAGRLVFQTITGTQTLPLIQGPQNAGRFGGFHVWTAVKLVDIAPSDVDTLTVTLTSSEGATEAEIVRRPAGLFFDPCEGGLCAAGLAPRLMDCCRVADATIGFRVEALANDGRTASAAATARASACPPDDVSLCP